MILSNKLSHYNLYIVFYLQINCNFPMKYVYFIIAFKLIVSNVDTPHSHLQAHTYKYKTDGIISPERYLQN